MKITHNIATHLKSKLKGSYLFMIWVCRFFIKSPCFEVYVRRLGKVNRRYFQKVRYDIQTQQDNHLKKFYSVQIPKKIWIYWAQGEAEAPLIVKICIERWKQLNPEWEVNILHSKNISEFINQPALPECLPVRYHANLIRTMLLELHGGVWADATTYCHRSLDSWLPMMASSGFFMFTNPADDRDIENWFIASDCHHPIITEWRKNLEKYYTKMSHIHPEYFLAFYIYQWMLKNNDELKSYARVSSGINAGPSFLMKSVLLGRTEFNELEKHLRSGFPVSKLDWKSNIPDDNFSEFIETINNITK